MNNIKIVVDSSSDLVALRQIPFASAPLKIVTDNKEYVDNTELDVHAFAEEMYSYKGTSRTSCPNVTDWIEAFGDAEKIFCLTITSNLSGSYNSACLAKTIYEEDHPGRRVEVIDTLSAGPEIALMAKKIRDMIVDGKDFDTVAEEIKGYKTELLFMLESMKNLANNGRVGRLAATAAGVLGIRAVGRASDEGTLEMLSKCRGTIKALDAIVEYMKDFGFYGGRVRIDHCLNENAAKILAKKIKSEFPSANIVIVECRGLCSFYAERGGMLVGYEV